ncbi:MAG: 3',5'-cyclic-nucleotide phosphodiesterase [Herminiimonas sp.]|nr:3',5'-cyclic-nucleotide phosphodiesterase [Herminiimonas sp.]
MKLTVLGCAGGIGGKERHTTCLWLDEDILLDAGTGLAQLDVEQLAGIDHIFLTHCHLDHVAGLALLLDAIAGKRTSPVTVHASGTIIGHLKAHLFNWILWPDFSMIPNEADPVLRWEAIEAEQEITLHGRIIGAHLVNHTNGSVAYSVRKQEKGFLFTGDMCATPELWQRLIQEKNLSKVIVDCSFPNAEADLAAKSMHFCPGTLIDDIRGITSEIEFLVYHLKPGQEDAIMEELKAAGGERNFKALKNLDRYFF